MIEPRISRLARVDLDEIWTYITADSSEAADRMIDAIVEGCRRYARFPGMGQNLGNYRADLRSFVISPYVVFYRAVDDTIEVLRVLHGARNIDQIFSPGIGEG